MLGRSASHAAMLAAERSGRTSITSDARGRPQSWRSEDPSLMPFVESHRPRSGKVGQTLVPYEMPQDGSSAACEAHPSGQFFARPPSNAVTQQAQNAGRTSCLSRTRIHHARRSLGEDGLPAASVPTLPSTNRERDPQWSALDGQIPEPPLCGAVPGRRDDVRSQACRRGADLFRPDGPDVINQHRRVKSDIRNR